MNFNALRSVFASLPRPVGMSVQMQPKYRLDTLAFTAKPGPGNVDITGERFHDLTVKGSDGSTKVLSTQALRLVKSAGNSRYIAYSSNTSKGFESESQLFRTLDAQTGRITRIQLPTSVKKISEVADSRTGKRAFLAQSGSGAVDLSDVAAINPRTGETALLRNRRIKSIKDGVVVLEKLKLVGDGSVVVGTERLTIAELFKKK